MANLGDRYLPDDELYLQARENFYVVRCDLRFILQNSDKIIDFDFVFVLDGWTRASLSVSNFLAHLSRS